MSILNALSRFASRHRARRIRARTLRQIGDLPHFMQKDIGFPDGDGFGEEIRNRAPYASERPQ
ncbi:MAG: hypothetical protein Q8Q62_21805 [Mesorhizobium sp.]|nr:hypothetical protein [Mesorhizobium sp.]